MYDAIVVGARCSGSPTAMLLARKGYRVLLLDRAASPSDSIRNHFIQHAGVVQFVPLGAAAVGDGVELPASAHHHH